MKSYLQELEAESIHIIRESVAEAQNPVMLYSVGKDSSVMVRLARKAFYPAPIPFPLLHVDTSYKFPEMYEFRDKFIKDEGLNLITYRNEQEIAAKMDPFKAGTDKCCSLLKTKALLAALSKHKFDIAFGGARREEEKSRAKERIFSVRDRFGQWDPKRQRPELWNLYNAEMNEGESMRVFPLSNWTEKDIWNYIKIENIPIVPIYFSIKRDAWYLQGNPGLVFPCNYIDGEFTAKMWEKYGCENMVLEEDVPCRFRSLGCIPCTGAIRSEATTIDQIIEELQHAKKSERENRLIDLSSESSMETKKRSGYF